MLRDRVGGAGSAAAQTRLRGGVDDCALAPCEHVRQRSSGKEERGGQVDADDSLSLRVRDVCGCTRLDIAREAVRLLTTKGVAATSAGEIADGAGISVRTLWRL